MSSINAMAAGGPGAGVVERPRTATTTVTTVSSSPKHHGRKKSTSPNAGDATAPNAADTQIQSLLRAGLEKAKATLSPQVYATLEATANDALALASVFGSNSQHQHQQHHSQLSSSGMSVLSMAAGSDRQLKRKVDNLCRSLTELCISLADEKLIALSKNRPGSRDATTAASSNLPQLNGMDPTSSNSSSTVNYRRSTSHEPDDLGRQGGSQGLNRTLAGSRLDGRRSSMLNLSTGNAVRSSQEASDSQTTIKLSSTTPATSTSRISRSSTTAGLLRQNRRQHDDEDKNNSGDRSSSSLLQRPPSRVFTDTPDSSSKPRHHTSLLTRSSRELLQSAKYQQQAQQPQQRSYLPAQPTTKFRTSNSNSNNTSNNNQQSGSAIPLRRGYLSPAIPATGSPTPSSHLHLKVQPGYRRYGSSVIDPGTTTNATTRETSPQLNDGSDVASSSPLQYTGSNGAIAGAGNGTPLTRTASHVSSMQQLRPRPRTNSFGTRRLSLRRTTMGRD